MGAFLKFVGFIIVVAIMWAIGYLFCVGFSALLLFVLTKMGFVVDLNIWWTGLFVFILSLLFK